MNRSRLALLPARADTVFALPCALLVSVDLEFLLELPKSPVTAGLMEGGSTSAAAERDGAGQASPLNSISL